jgi:hypothetical protein
MQFLAELIFFFFFPGDSTGRIASRISHLVRGDFSI